MHLSKISIKNFRALRNLPNIGIGAMTTIVGRNDTGKSSILYALNAFFGHEKVTQDDFNKTAPQDPIEISVSFEANSWAVQLEEGVDTDLSEEKLLNSAGELQITKRFYPDNPAKPQTILVVSDFGDEFGNLCSLKEPALNKLGDKHGIDFKKSGRSITNKDKRMALRRLAIEKRLSLEKGEIEPSKDLLSTLTKMQPTFSFFIADTKLGIEEATFQNQFQAVVEKAVSTPEIEASANELKKSIKEALGEEFAKIFARLKQHTDTLESLNPKPEILWKKAVKFDLEGMDTAGLSISLMNRGIGLRRLLMVAFFQYLVEEADTEARFMFALEEPETFLHPGAQRFLAKSLNDIAEKGHQVIVTSHSPVFAGFSPVENLVLLKRTGGIAAAFQSPNLRLEEVASDMGIEPMDQVFGYKACVFVEGKTDAEFLASVVGKLKKEGLVEHTFEERGIGMIPVGGNNLKYLVTSQVLKAINRNYGVLIDSDRKNSTDGIPQRKTNWQGACLAEGGKFYITKKREIENYLHSEAVSSFCGKATPFDDFTDMKETFGPNIVKAVKHMTANDILECDKYVEAKEEKHELLEIVRDFLSMVDT